MRYGFSAALALLLAACSSDGPPPPDRCRIKVLELEKWDEHDQGLDVSYIVGGEAGTAGKVWLAAKNPSGEFVSGFGVEVGPGLYKAAVELELTGEPKSFVAVLETSVKRCRDYAEKPD